MTPDQQEARSCQHAAGVQVIPLSSGRFAIFELGAFLEAVICDGDDLVITVTRLASIQLEKRPSASSISATLEELGL